MNKFLVIVSLFLTLWFSSVYAAWVVDHFEIEASPNKVKIWESIDITIKAVDKDWAVVKDYDKEVLIFSNSDQKAELPSTIDSWIYKFKTSDAWVVKFENWVKFTQKWTQDISVYDYNNEDIYWYAEVEVTDWTTSAQSSGDITINYPENWITLWQNSVKVSGTTSKNHKLRIKLNSGTWTETISNSEWVYEVELKDIPTWDNIIVAELLDADSKVIWTSSETFFKVESNTPVFKSITLNPESDEYNSESVVWVSVDATPWLTTVSVMVNDVLSTLTENKSWTYSWEITTPKTAWEYNIDVILKNELWLETKKEAATSIKVKEVEYLAWVEEVKKEEPVTVNCDDFKKELEVKNVKSISLKTKSVISWDKVDKATSYNIYKKDASSSWLTLIENVTDNKYEVIISWNKVEYSDFTIKAVFKDDVCNVEWDNQNMTKVQTWPKEIAILIIALLSWAWIMYVRRKNA